MLVDLGFLDGLEVQKCEAPSAIRQPSPGIYMVDVSKLHRLLEWCMAYDNRKDVGDTSSVAILDPLSGPLAIVSNLANSALVARKASAKVVPAVHRAVGVYQAYQPVRSFYLDGDR